jgi:hypothetical protein
MRLHSPLKNHRIFPNRLAALMTDDQFKTLVRELRIIQIGIASTAAKDVRH